MACGEHARVSRITKTKTRKKNIAMVCAQFVVVPGEMGKMHLCTSPFTSHPDSRLLAAVGLLNSHDVDFAHLWHNNSH